MIRLPIGECKPGQRVRLPSGHGDATVEGPAPDRKGEVFVDTGDSRDNYRWPEGQQVLLLEPVL